MLGRRDGVLIKTFAWRVEGWVFESRAQMTKVLFFHRKTIGKAFHRHMITYPYDENYVGRKIPNNQSI